MKRIIVAIAITILFILVSTSLIYSSLNKHYPQIETQKKKIEYTEYLPYYHQKGSSIKAIHTLLSAKSGDKVRIHTSRAGINPEESAALINAIKKSKAHVTFNIGDSANNLTAVAALHADSLIMNRNGYLSFKKSLLENSSYYRTNPYNKLIKSFMLEKQWKMYLRNKKVILNEKSLAKQRKTQVILAIN